MKKFILVLFVLVFSAGLFGQDRIPQQYVNPEGKITLASTMPFTQAIKALNEISSRIDKILIIDSKIRSHAINVEINDLPWKDALLLILRMNNLNYEEHPNYIKIVDTVVEEEKVEEVLYHSKMREVNINAIFFEADRHALREIGINWNYVIEKGNKAYTYYQNAIGLKSEEDKHRFTVEELDAGEDEQPMMLIKALESRAIGDILANPSVTVIDGEPGRIQVGQDFTIKQFDFAGNVTDQVLSSGIILSVTPTIVSEDSITFIHLDVNAEKSSVSPGAVSTLINKTSTSTSLFLIDGERAVIAGLYSSDKTTQRAGVPILKDLPWWFFGLKYIFGYNRNETTEKELVIIIQAKLLPTLKDRKISEQSNMKLINEKREELRNKFK